VNRVALATADFLMIARDARWILRKPSRVKAKRARIDAAKSDRPSTWALRLGSMEMRIHE